MRLWSVFIVSLHLSFGCGPEPVFDDDLRVTPEATEPGALAGRFAMKSVTLTLSEFPLIGEQETGSEVYYLIERTWDRESATYLDERRTCGGRLYETVGGSSSIETRGWEALKVARSVSNIDHATGEVSMDDYVELWSVDLEDPLGDFPSSAEEALEFPEVIDGDNDGELGVTINIEGIISGDVFFVQRRTGEFRGAVRSADEIIGVNKFEKTQIVIGATDDLLNDQLASRRHPDPLESWYQQVRLNDNAGCGDVMSALEDGTLSRLRPFARD